MLDQEIINQQLDLLATHRRTLAHLIEQAAQYGGEVFAPPQTANGIAEARQQIRRIKATLHKNGVQVEDIQNDKALRRRKSAQSQHPGDVISGDKVAGDKIGGDKVMGDKQTIDTGGGDYAEGGIDKREGIFGGTIQGVGIGVNKGTININPQPPLSTALHQLRAPVSDFVGREQEIDQLVEALSKASGAAAAISGVRGMGGIGKTELAYVVANRLKDVFPDAQIVIELRGASSRPLTPEQALQIVIRSFERETNLPNSLSQLQALYCSMLTGKRILLLADDARDIAQVRSLLPPLGCVLLVTSRNRFSLPGMEVLDLGTLPPGEAEKLLLNICPRIGSYAGELAKLCGYLALALQVSARLLKENDSRDVARYLKQLWAERLKYLNDPDNLDDPNASVEASLRLSYDGLEPVAKDVLCKISHTFGGASFNLEKVQSCFRESMNEVIEKLRRRSLIEWNAEINRYQLHDLVWAFGAQRRIEHCKHQLVKVRELGDRKSEAEILAKIASTYHFRGSVSNAVEYFERALVIYSEIGDLKAQCGIMNGLGLVYCQLGDERHGISCIEQSLDLARQVGDRHVEKAALNNLGLHYVGLGEVSKGISFLRQCLDLARQVHDENSTAHVGWFLGRALAQQGDLLQAVEIMQISLDLARSVGDEYLDMKHSAELEEIRQRLASSKDPSSAESPIERSLYPLPRKS